MFYVALEVADRSGYYIAILTLFLILGICWAAVIILKCNSILYNEVLTQPIVKSYRQFQLLEQNEIVEEEVASLYYCC